MHARGGLSRWELGDLLGLHPADLADVLEPVLTNRRAPATRDQASPDVAGHHRRPGGAGYDRWWVQDHRDAEHILKTTGLLHSDRGPHHADVHADVRYSLDRDTQRLTPRARLSAPESPAADVERRVDVLGCAELLLSRRSRPVSVGVRVVARFFRNGHWDWDETGRQGCVDQQESEHFLFKDARSMIAYPIHDELDVLATVQHVRGGRDEVPITEVTHYLGWEHRHTVAVLARLVSKNMLQTDAGLGDDPTVIVF